MNRNPERTWDRPTTAQDQDCGFTLIELLVILVILGVIAAIAVFAVINAEPNTARSACQTTYKTVEAAAEAYEAQTGQYPTTIAALTGEAPGLDGAMDGPWLKDMPNTYSPGPIPSITNSGMYGMTIDSTTNAIAVGTIKANGASSDTGTPLVDGNANCFQA